MKKSVSPSTFSVNNSRGRGRGGVMPSNKPPPLMARPVLPPMGMRRPPFVPPFEALPPHPMHGFGPRMRPPEMNPFDPRSRGRGWGPRRGAMPLISRGAPPRGLIYPPPRLPPPPHVYHGRPPPPPQPIPFFPDSTMRPPFLFRGRGRGARFPTRGFVRGRGRGASTVGRKPNTKIVKSNPKALTTTPGELDKPWVTEVIKNEILKKHKLHAKAKKSDSKEDWNAFREHRNKVTGMLREAKLKYINSSEPNQEEANKILDENLNQDSINAESEEAVESSEANECSSPKLTENEITLEI